MDNIVNVKDCVGHFYYNEKLYGVTYEHLNKEDKEKFDLTGEIPETYSMHMVGNFSWGV